ncbi:hypothetical protein B296_00045828 [Ensete ventricosum]|uniref:Uncharacterized protein n=1 Tax=Ensete ventricosum TaxID=4639 RepID=A0A426X4C3_ENSVE|nr:hypothetical protein B296_00045828 [Ensete ventricosum]
MGGSISRHPSRLRQDLCSSDNGGQDTPSNLACVKLEKVLYLERQNFGKPQREHHMHSENQNKKTSFPRRSNCRAKDWGRGKNRKKQKNHDA